MASVTPFVGVWIETKKNRSVIIGMAVTPFVGVWIETYPYYNVDKINIVTPFVGVWIETGRAYTHRIRARSHPSWVCGLKR